MQINMKKNVEKRRNTGANRTPTPRMGYVRIEPEAGGAADRRRIYAPCIEAVGYLTDARGEPSARGEPTTKG